MHFFIFLVAFASAFVMSNAATDKVFCYVSNWSSYRYGNGKFDINNVDPTLCTHVIYAYIVPTANGKVQLTDSWIDETQGGLNKLRALKSKNPNVKLLVSIGGYNQGSVDFSNIIDATTKRTTLVTDIVAFLKAQKLDGLDVNWQFPAKRGGKTVDKSGLVTFLKDLKAAFTASKYLLTVAVSGLPEYISPSYDIQGMNSYVDFFNILSYDYPTKTLGLATHSSPLYASKVLALSPDAGYNVDATVKAYLAAGASPSKIIIGISLNGRTHSLASTSGGTIGSKFTGPGNKGRYTYVAGTLTYLESCELRKEGGWVTYNDAGQLVPYAIKGNQFMAFENKASVVEKTKYAQWNNLAGVMVYSVDSADHKNICGEGSFPLLRSINSVLQSTVEPPPVTVTIQPPATTKSTTTTSKPTTKTTTKATTAPPTGNSCPASGFYRDPSDCAGYYRCSPSNPNMTHLRYQCPKTTVFDMNTKICVYGTC